MRCAILKQKTVIPKDFQTGAFDHGDDTIVLHRGDILVNVKAELYEYWKAEGLAICLELAT